MTEDESDDEWRFSVDEFDDSGPGSSGDAADDAGHNGREDSDFGDPTADTGAHTDDADDEYDGEGNVAGEFAPQVPVVPEMPELENAVFVTLGAILTVLAFAAVVGGPSFGLFDALTVVAVVGAVGAGLYLAFVHLTPDT